jgi:UDP-glucose:(heptosyl)LPS alpha-1,3-glucosyltransferase
MHIIQVVKRWGRVGGMETYVWNLSHQLINLNCKVTIVCEKSYERTPQNIQVIQVGAILKHPRWLNYWIFRLRSNAAIKKIRKLDTIVHSHERSINHDVTTFHSMPFDFKEKKRWLSLFSLRKKVYFYMEKWEVTGRDNRKLIVVPVSGIIASELKSRYPGISQNINNPITPGVELMNRRSMVNPSSDKGTIGFIGKEWKRKGFEKFIQIAKLLQKIRPNLKLLVAGCSESELKAAIENYDGPIDFKGWTPSRDLFQQMDLLIHPASSEAYGMVIAEAMSCFVPVIVSKSCGASKDVDCRNGTVLSESDDTEKWAESAEYWLSNTKPLLGFSRPWSVVANDYLCLYKSIIAVKSDT